MQHPFAALKGEYERRLASMKVTRRKLVDQAAHKLLRPAIFDRHLELQEKTNVPAIFSATLFEREASSDFRLSFGQGDPWNRVSTHVPRGHKFTSWLASAIFYTGTHKLNVFSSPLSMPFLCWKGEAWNGFGPRAHGRPTGYLWAGTNQYDPPAGPGGKYIADGRWSSGTVDAQLGIIPVMARMLELRPELDDRFAIQFNAATLVPDVEPVPDGVGGGEHDAKWIQESLNKIGQRPPLNVDGNYGKLTRAAVRLFQETHNITVDGLAGPETFKAMEETLARMLGLYSDTPGGDDSAAEAIPAS